MRTTLSFLVAALAGLLAVLATAGALVDEATHRPELLRGVTAVSYTHLTLPTSDLV